MEKLQRIKKTPLCEIITFSEKVWAEKTDTYGPMEDPWESRNTALCGHLFPNMDTRVFQGGKNTVCDNQCEETRCPHAKMKSEHDLTPCKKVNSKWIKEQTLRAETLSSSEVN